MPDYFPSLPELIAGIRSVPGLPDLNEPGFASTFKNNTLPVMLYRHSALVPLGATAAGLWYLNKKQKTKPVPVRREKQAAPDWRSALDVVRYHLPKLRVPDTAAGLALGAGAGGLYDLLRGRDKETGKRKTLQRVLTGALAGAGAANLAGDRLRRYISNTKIPAGYSRNAVAELTPTWKRVWNAGILDKPSYRPQDIKAHSSDAYFIPARQEIVRRQFGLPVQDAKNPWWQKNKDGYYSLNEKSPDYQQRLRLLFGRTHDPVSDTGNSQLQQILDNPVAGLSAFSQNSAQQGKVPLFATQQIVGGSQLPFVKDPDGSTYGMVLDRFDQTPSEKERQFLAANWWRALSPRSADRAWMNKKLDKELSWYLRRNTHSNRDVMKTLGARWAWDNVLSDEVPWIGQKFKITPRPPAAQGTPGPNQFAFLKEDGTPAVAPMTYNELTDWNNKVPDIDRAITQQWQTQLPNVTP